MTTNNNKASFRYLAWDTSTPTGIIAAFEVAPDGLVKLVSEWSLSLDAAKHSERLLWTIDLMLESAGWSLGELAGIVVGIGPGSFTGLRIGLTTAKILGMRLNIPLYPVSSLAVLARPAAAMVLNGAPAITNEEKILRNRTLILGCVDATKGEWFTLMGPAEAVYGCVVQRESGLASERGHRWAADVSEQAIPPEQVFVEANKYLAGEDRSVSWLAVGQSVERYPDLFKALPAERRWLPKNYFIHQAEVRSLVALGAEAIQSGLACPSAQVFPRYLRESDAQVKLKKGLLKPQALTSPPKVGRT